MHKFRNKPGLKKARLSLESLLYLFACVKERKQCVCLKAHDRELQHRELIRLMAPVIMRAITWVDSHESTWEAGGSGGLRAFLPFLLCQAVMLNSLKMPPLSVDILSSCPSQQQLSL